MEWPLEVRVLLPVAGPGWPLEVQVLPSAAGPMWPEAAVAASTLVVEPGCW
jgi:hypothetical protein